MSTGGAWECVLSYCLERQLPVIPAEPEPWFSLEAVAAILGKERETLRKRLRGVPRHPVFEGFVQFSSLSGSAE